MALSAVVLSVSITTAAQDLRARKRFIGARERGPDPISRVLRQTAADMKLPNFGGDIGPQRVDNAVGFEFDTGFGFVDAQRALRATKGF